MKALVVDGYNAIHKIPYLRAMADRGDLLRARAEITTLAVLYKRKRGGIDKICVVFDGNDMYRNAAFKTPENQSFSKTGKGDQKVIVTVAKFSEKYHVEVVSDDNYIINNSRAYKAAIVKVAKFIAFIDKKAQKHSKKYVEDKVMPRNISKINEELKKEWNL